MSKDSLGPLNAAGLQRLPEPMRAVFEDLSPEELRVASAIQERLNAVRRRSKARPPARAAAQQQQLSLLAVFWNALAEFPARHFRRVGRTNAVR